MPRENYERRLHALQEEVLLLGSMVDQAIERSVASLAQRNATMAHKVIADDELINQKRFEIEETAMLLIATQQPMASDLRLLTAILFISTELERIADHAAGIAKINLLMGDEPLIKPLIDVPRMTDQTRKMLHQALDALIRRDAEGARRTALEDDIVDDLYNQVYNELLTFMLRDPKTISQATYLLWVAHNLERIGDRITNVCERAIFVVTGRMEEIKTKSDGLLMLQAEERQNNS